LLAIKIVDIVERKQTITEAFLAERLNAQEEGSSRPEEPPNKEQKESSEEISAGKEAPAEENFYDKTPQFSQTELEILQRLSLRREKLEEWQSELEVKENILNITQAKIDNKIDELKSLKKQVEELLVQYNNKEEEKTRSLVKIYENMKPKSAAEIFTRLEPETLLPVLSRMKEAKIALILANMDPKQAKDLTTKFSEFMRLPEENGK